MSLGMILLLIVAGEIALWARVEHNNRASWRRHDDVERRVLSHKHRLSTLNLRLNVAEQKVAAARKYASALAEAVQEHLGAH